MAFPSLLGLLVAGRGLLEKRRRGAGPPSVFQEPGGGARKSTLCRLLSGRSGSRTIEADTLSVFFTSRLAQAGNGHIPCGSSSCLSTHRKEGACSAEIAMRCSGVFARGSTIGHTVNRLTCPVSGSWNPAIDSGDGTCHHCHHHDSEQWNVIFAAESMSDRSVDRQADCSLTQ